nr:Mov34/MPN/PAD-1 family protein [Sinorhizobium medicae]
MARTRIVIPRAIWLAGLTELHRRGGERHESGAFLLGKSENGKSVVSRWVFYDELDPNAYSTGVCVLYAESFDRLWSLCRKAGLAVIADVHTHPGSPTQSHSDRTNPMVSTAGHTALIIPNFACGPYWRHKLGVYRYEGDHQWTNLSGWRARGLLKTGTFR